jgi:hypothetical protein
MTTPVPVGSRRLGVLLAASALLLGGCSSSGGPDAAAPEESAASARTTAVQDPAAGTTSPAGDGDASSTAGVPAADPTDDPDPDVTEEPAPEVTTVVLVFAEWDASSGTVQAGGHVSSVVEDGGECTLTLDSGGTTVSASTQGFADATTTVCSGLQVGADQLTPGTWTATLQYTPLSAAPGSSNTVDVVVP